MKRILISFLFLLAFLSSFPQGKPESFSKVTSPIFIGGNTAASNISYISSLGNAPTGIAHIFKGGNVGATTIMTLRNDGKVGIGTTAPVAPMDIAGASSIGTISFTGGGLNDATLSGTFIGNVTQTLRIKITTTGTPDKFDWSIDGGSTWVETGKNIVSGAIALNYTGVSVTFGATTGHTLNSYWQATLIRPTGIVNVAGSLNIGGSQFVSSSGTNILIGNSAMGNGKNTGRYNTANGYNSLYSNTTGSYNTANGYNSLYSNTTGSYNTANGYNSLYSNTTGINNTATGYYSLYSNTTGSNNTANGYQSLYSNTTGSYNMANGYNAQGITPSRPSGSAVAGGLIDAGVHNYLVTYVINGIEHPSQWRSVTNTLANAKTDLTGISIYSGPQPITYKRIYRTVMAGGATATATVSGGIITAITLTAGGTGYGSTAVVAITPKDAGTSAVITATGITGGVIQQSNLTITNGGSGYTVAPTITISKYPANDPYKFYKVADIPLANTTYTDSLSDVTIIANGTLPTGMSNSVLLGYNSTGTGSGQFVIGDASAPVTDTYFGGVFHSTSSTAGLHHTIHGMGGNGTDKAGGNLTIAGGKGTGIGLGGAIIFQTSPASTTSANENTLTEVGRFSSTGNLGIGTTNPAYKLDVSGTARVTAIAVSTTDTTSVGYPVGTIQMRITAADTSAWLLIRTDGSITARWKKLTP